MIETLFSLLAAIFWVAIISGWLWIIANAFTEGGALWGIGCVLFSPLCVIYAVLNYAQLKTPLLLAVGGGVGLFVLCTLPFLL